MSTILLQLLSSMNVNPPMIPQESYDRLESQLMSVFGLRKTAAFLEKENWVKLSHYPDEEDLPGRYEGFFRHAHEELTGELDGVEFNYSPGEFHGSIRFLKLEIRPMEAATLVALVHVSSADYFWSYLTVQQSDVTRILEMLPGLFLLRE